MNVKQLQWNTAEIVRGNDNVMESKPKVVERYDVEEKMR